MKASLTSYRQSPRKVRLVANLIKGKRVPEAVVQLQNLPKRAGLPLKKLIESAAANARTQGGTPDSLVIKDIRVDKGFMFKRMDPRARGSAYLVRKRTSNIVVMLGEGAPAKKKAKKAKTEAK